MALQVDYVPSLYEVVMPTSLCRLYFDLEYSRQLNATRTTAMDTACVCHLTRLIARALHGLPHTIQQLQSHSSAKWSLHLIVHCPTMAPLTRVVGVRSVALDIIHQFRASCPHGTVHRSTGTTCLIDAHVYSSFQQFRLAFCSKWHQNRPLLLTDHVNVPMHHHSAVSIYTGMPGAYNVVCAAALGLW